ncbi:hypothetical protein VTI28DRAFT_6585 [Corynascus sepedonium]
MWEASPVTMHGCGVAYRIRLPCSGLVLSRSSLTAPKPSEFADACRRDTKSREVGWPGRRKPGAHGLPLYGRRTLYEVAFSKHHIQVALVTRPAGSPGVSVSQTPTTPSRQCRCQAIPRKHCGFLPIPALRERQAGTCPRAGHWPPVNEIKERSICRMHETRFFSVVELTANSVMSLTVAQWDHIRLKLIVSGAC